MSPTGAAWPPGHATPLRPMRWWDIPAVMDIETRVFPTTAWTAGQFWSELAQADRTYVVADIDDRIVAYGGVMVRRPTADIQTIAVDPGLRRRGFGRGLLAHLLAAAGDQGCTEVMLEVRADNVEALDLYAEAGFDVIARRSAYYGPGQDALIMRRRAA